MATERELRKLEEMIASGDKFLIRQALLQAEQRGRTKAIREAIAIVGDYDDEEAWDLVRELRKLNLKSPWYPRH